MTAFADAGDLCLGFWASYWNHGTVTLTQGARVLEIGSAEADWITPMRAARRDLEIVGIDVRESVVDGVIRGDVLTHDFPAASFDAIVAISSVEHIGLGGYGDPVDEDGDHHTMQRCRRWLKDGVGCIWTCRTETITS